MPFLKEAADSVLLALEGPQARVGVVPGVLALAEEGEGARVAAAARLVLHVDHVRALCVAIQWICLHRSLLKRTSV